MTQVDVQSAPPDPTAARDRAAYVECLRLLRAERSYRQVAGRRDRLYYISPSTVQNVEQGRSTPTRKSILGYLTGCGLDRAAAQVWLDKYDELYSTAAVSDPDPARPGTVDDPDTETSSILLHPDPAVTQSLNSRPFWQRIVLGVVAVLSVAVMVAVVTTDRRAERPQTMPPSMVTASSFVSFSDDGIPPPTSVVGDVLTIEAPENDYSALRGVITPARLCSVNVDLDLRIDYPSSQSVGYGIGLGTTTEVMGGTFRGKTVQLEHDNSHRGFVTRSVTLPEGASQLSPSVPVEMDAGAWHHLHIETRPTGSTVTLDHTIVPGSPFAIDQPCGSILIRVWGTTVAVKGIDVQPA
jgi:hypothetical protein